MTPRSQKLLLRARTRTSRRASLTLLAGGLLLVSLFLAETSFAQDINDPAVFLQSILNQIGAGNTGQQAAATSTATLSIAPEPAQTGEIVIATAELSNPALASSARFTWFVDGVMRADISGIAQASTAFVAPKTPGTLRVGVRVETETASTTAEKTVILEESAVSRFFKQLDAQAQDLVRERARLESEGSISVESFPERPKPGELVTFVAKSFQFDINEADITWAVNGKPARSGKGLTTFTMTAGAAGSLNEVEARVNSSGGAAAAQSVTVVPVALRFYWWTNTYVPAWYRGKALPSPGARILIEARPSFPENIKAALTYSWYVNDQLIREASGVGKTILAHSLPTLPSLENSVRVRVTNAAKTIDAEETFILPKSPAEALVYEVRPLEGVNAARAVQSLTRPAGKTVEFLVEPFFVPRLFLDSLEYRWRLNGQPIGGGDAPRPRYFTLTSTAESRGVQSLSVSFEDAARRISSASRSLNVMLE